ncbi:MAG: CAP domain-containing protein [Planctomycetota bacterium]
MTRNLRRVSLLAGLALALAVRPAAAQDAFAKEEQDLIKACVSTLSNFASTAKSQKVGQRAKQAYDLVLQYDPNQPGARGELGFKKEKDQWVALPPEKRKKWVDKASYEGRFKVMDEWAKTSVKLGDQHKKLGLKLKEAGNAVRATFHLEKAVYYNPMDKEANLALGYKEGPGFFGTEPQIAMALKMKEIEKRAVELARKEYPVTQLPEAEMPAELVALRDAAPDWMKKPNFNIFGAKSENFTVWTRGTQEMADNAVKWAERAVEFGVYLMGEDMAKRLRFRERAIGSYSWHAFLATEREREVFLEANPGVRGGGDVKAAMRFANNEWRSTNGPAVLKVGGSPRQIQDSLVAYVTFTGLLAGRNDGVGQGIVHAVTWYMKATSISRWGALPEGTQGDDALELPEGTNWWMRTVRDQAMSNQDWAMGQVPREKLSRFRNDCRLKAWSMMTWMMAAYPDKWLPFFLALPDADKQVPTLEQIEEVVVKVFGKSSEAIDAEWREWARGDSGVAFGTGYGPPLLPERPSKEELAALDRINQVRMQPIGFVFPTSGNMTEGKFVPLTECEMDAETSIGTDLHAKYVMNHRELADKNGPDIHEEDPAHEDFTRRGQQAGSGNIVTVKGQRGAEFARDSVDGWIGTPYHRFPMLRHNIKRLGFAYLTDTDFSVGVLDMGSMEEPYDPATSPNWVVWPPHNHVGVPTAFPSFENPNPLEDLPEGQNDVRDCGYTISVQFSNEMQKRLGESSISLWEANKGGKQPLKNYCAKGQEDYTAWMARGKKEVPCHVHTPNVPLNKKQDRRDVLFALPKQHLEPNKHYQVRCLLQVGTADPLWFFWEFTTGSSGRDLKLK